MSVTFAYTIGTKEFTLAVEIDQYEYGGLAIQVYDAENDEPWTTASIKVFGVSLAEDEFVFKTYSENEGLLEAMLAAGIVEKTGRYAEVGFAGHQPICRLLKDAEERPAVAVPEGGPVPKRHESHSSDEPVSEGLRS